MEVKIQERVYLRISLKHKNCPAKRGLISLLEVYLEGMVCVDINTSSIVIWDFDCIFLFDVALQVIRRKSVWKM